MIRNRPWKRWTDMIKIMVLATDNVIWSVREATNAPNNLFMRLAVRSVKWRKQNLTGAQFKRERYNDAVEFLQTAFSRWWRWWRWWYHGVQDDDKDDHWYNICWQPRVGRGQLLAGICLISFISLLYCLVSTFCISFILWSMILFSILLISLV